MQLKPGDLFVGQFVTVNGSGALTDADSTPTADVTREGTIDGGVTPTVTKMSTGRYKVTFTVPTTYVVGDIVNVTALYVMSTVNKIVPVQTFSIDSHIADVPPAITQGVIGQRGIVGANFQGFAEPNGGTDFTDVAQFPALQTVEVNSALGSFSGQTAAAIRTTIAGMSVSAANVTLLRALLANSNNISLTTLAAATLAGWGYK